MSTDSLKKPVYHRREATESLVSCVSSWGRLLSSKITEGGVPGATERQEPPTRTNTMQHMGRHVAYPMWPRPSNVITGTQTTATTVVIPPSSTALPHTFDTKGISDIEPLPESSSLDRRQREEKKMSTITPATTASSSKPEDEEGDSDLDKLLMESPTTTGISVRRHHGTSSLRFGSTHSGYSDSGIFETSSPGSTATHSLARSSTTTSKKKQNIRPVVRDMYSEYTTSTPRSEDAMMVERGKTVLSTISIKLRPTMDASISTDDFYFPLDASVLLPAQSAAPLIMSRATISTPTLPLTTVPFPPSSRSDQQTQTELRPLKTKRKSTKHILLFHPSHYPVKTRVEPVPPHAHGASDQLCAEQTVDLGTSVPAPAGVILVKSTTAATSTAAMEAKPVNQALRETAHGKRKRGEEEEEDMEVPSAAVAIQDPTSAEESADSMEASWYQPHLHLSDKTKRFHKKIRRKYKDAEEDMDIGGEKDSKAEQYVKQKGSGDEKLDFNKGIPKAGINKMEKEGQGEKRVKDQREDITKKDVIEIKEKDIRTPQFDFRIKEHGKYEGNESAERKRNNETTKCKAEADEEQSENRSAKVRKHQKKLKGFNMPQIKIKSKVKTPHEEIKAPMAKKKDVSNEEVKTAEGLKDVGMPVADAHADVDGNVVGGKEKIPSFKSGSLPISPRDFYAHSTTPEFKRPSGVETIDEECSGTAERKKSEKNMLDWFRLSWRRTKRRRSGVSTSSGVEDGRSLSNTGRRRPKPLKHKKTTVQNTAVTLITSTPVEDEDLGIQADVVPTTQLSVSSPRSKYQRSEEKNAEPALPMEAEVLWAEQKTAEFPVGFSNTRGSTKTKCKKRSTKPTKPDQPLIKDEPNASTPRLRKSSGSLTSERLQRQTWHHPEVAISPIIDANSRTPPKSPLSPRLDDDISEWFSHAYRSHYADTSPLRKPRPWSTLDFPPQNCTFLNDDHLFPYSITPTKLPSCRWKSDKEYDVPYIDDDALPLDEPEWALGESRRTLTLTSADADFWRTAIAEEERSEASGESGWGSKRHLKKCRSLVPYHFKEKNRVQPSRTPRLVKPPVEGTDQFSKRA
ncbi:hypothetical protein EGR_05496 [Echinococcus granulosus]|uniref:Uncharacterized protein n=1 Tax=Echinococcus granulosus TaxID=6210 RepID=W6UN46_ECHGR|nr:hypothetical protein EGR_05496 [Echinococcus granulosus]EUB59597.1 hypothetical protein EGR_05496 [Echinococcus granulosus]